MIGLLTAKQCWLKDASSVSAETNASGLSSEAIASGLTVTQRLMLTV